MQAAYPYILVIHSLLRWLVFGSVIFATFRSLRGYYWNRSYLPLDQSAADFAVRFTQIQFVLGLALYFLSPLIDYFLHNFEVALHERQARFFGMEHITMMIVAVGLISRGGAAPKRRETDKAKFKAMAIPFTLALIIILVNIPWPFSPFAARPFFRWF